MEGKRHSTVLIGWDGATFSVLDPFIRDGTMPFLAQFVAEGVRGILHSTVHPVTAAAWPSLMTGVNPGQHGVFDFVKVDRREDRYTYVLSTSTDLRAETIWAIAARQGCRVTSLNFISMFPAPDIPGLFVVPGFVPYQYLPRAIRPAGLYSRIKTIPGFEARELALDWNLERKALQGLPQAEYESWIKFHMLRERHWFDIVSMLMREEPCNLTAVLFDGVDKLQHLCYHLVDPQYSERYDSPWAKNIRTLCLEYFRQLDDFLRQIVQQKGEEARVFIASDHGFALAEDDVFYANVWLEQHGYLKWADRVPLDHEARLTMDSHSGSDTMFDWRGTTAFALTPSSNAIYIRTAGKSGAGVPTSEYHAFRRQLTDSLLGFRDGSGRQVVQSVLTREEAFPGEHMAEGPDLTLILRDRSFLSVLRADAPLKPRIAPYGTHHPDGIFLARGMGIPKGVELPAAPIVDVAPTLLYSLGLPIPGHMEGTVMLPAFEPSVLDANPVRMETLSGSSKAAAAPHGASAVDEGLKKAVMERLRALDYLQ
jgi:predicted AlkP superfamily phosphohydrolase/phosphomutase